MRLEIASPAPYMLSVSVTFCVVERLGDLEMPIYEYVCKHCQHELEALQKLSDDPLVNCPECSQPELQKKISAAGFRLSGSGWYETDFKSGNKKNLATGEKSSDSKTAEAKPAASGGNKAASGTKAD